jgi:hypothetical protein
LLRVEGKQLFGEFSVKYSDLLSNIVKQAAFYGATNKDISEHEQRNCFQFLSSLLPSNKLMDSDNTTTDTTKTQETQSASELNSLAVPPNIMEIEMFHLLVSLCLSMPNLYNQASINSLLNGSINDSMVFTLILQCHCVQILLAKIKLNTFKNDSDADDEDEKQTDSKKKEDDTLFAFYNHICMLLNGQTEKNDSVESKSVVNVKNITPKIISKTLKEALMPFIRCAAIFFSNYTDLTPSDVICEDNGVEKNFTILINFLGIESLTQILNIESKSLKNLCKT